MSRCCLTLIFDHTISQLVVKSGIASMMRPVLAAVNTPPPTPDDLSFLITVMLSGKTSEDLIASLCGSLPGLMPRSQDSVPHMMLGFR